MRNLGFVGIAGVWLYRLIVRPFLRRRCLHAESCSAHGIRMFREHGLIRALPLIRARVRSCRMPAAACFVIDAAGHARLLTASGHAGMSPPPRALEHLARRAEQ
ncbi:MAG: membrane protein insertion efficiency factor YidD [Deltaproteobacteria bacterium]|nr:membrane protein insertion efficiency factor YidD [Deltaproteobacteria bacterium]